MTYSQAVRLQTRLQNRTQGKLSIAIMPLGNDEYFLQLKPLRGPGRWSIYSELDWLHVRPEVLSVLRGLRRL